MDINCNEMLISVIAPVYNVELYLDRCVKSIVNQTYKNLEIILVDDGSLDNSGSKCDDWEKKDNRIKVIHKNNGGLSSARNAGIDIAQGEYIIFVDSDDIIHKDMILILKSAVDNNQCEIAFCDLKIVNDNEKIIDQNIGDLKYVNYTSTELINHWYDKDEVIHTVAWNKIYKRELFKEIRYPEGKLHEDEFTTYKTFLLANNITFVNEKLYYYIQRGNSITGVLNEKRLDVLDAFKERIKISKTVNKVFYEESNIAYLNLIISYYYKFKESNNFTVSKTLSKKFNNEYKKIKKFINISPKKKIRFLLFIVNKNIYKLIMDRL